MTFHYYKEQLFNIIWWTIQSMFYSGWWAIWSLHESKVVADCNYHNSNRSKVKIILIAKLYSVLLLMLGKLWLYSEHQYKHRILFRISVSIPTNELALLALIDIKFFVSAFAIKISPKPKIFNHQPYFPIASLDQDWAMSSLGSVSYTSWSGLFSM
jgi:hypothetical protein